MQGDILYAEVEAVSRVFMVRVFFYLSRENCLIVLVITCLFFGLFSLYALSLIIIFHDKWSIYYDMFKLD